MATMYGEEAHTAVGRVLQTKPCFLVGLPTPHCGSIRVGVGIRVGIDARVRVGVKVEVYPLD